MKILLSLLLALGNILSAYSDIVVSIVIIIMLACLAYDIKTLFRRKQK